MKADMLEGMIRRRYIEMKKKILMLMMAGMLSVVSLAGCSSFKEDEVVATVGDQKITADIANFYEIGRASCRERV